MFRQTFGFYEGWAAVEDDRGWCHAGVDGVPVYEQRYAWAGNRQQGRVPVRERDGAYRHLDERGRPISAGPWRYAGDFRDGVAVVQGDHGRSTHVHRDGRLLHGRWFLDLDVFHKGFARARDPGGWTHVDAAGRPAYARRFVTVEPFYNGQARVERSDGGLEVINEQGETVAELRGPLQSAVHALSDDLVSFWRCDAIFAAVGDGLFDRLPASDAALTHGLRRLLGALGELGLVVRRGDHWDATSRGALLRSGPGSMAPAARYWAGPGRAPWAALPRLLAGQGRGPGDLFSAMAGDRGLVTEYHAAMRVYAQDDYADLPAALPSGRFHVVDAGGGTGAVAEIVLCAHPEATATVLDRPEVVALAKAPPDLAGRLAFRAGDLLAPWPVTGDAVILARVLHDWDDDVAARILGHAGAALEPGGRVYVVELARSGEGCDGGLLDLHMLLSTGGEERTDAALEVLAGRAGLRVVERVSLRGMNQVTVLELG